MVRRKEQRGESSDHNAGQTCEGERAGRRIRQEQSQTAVQFQEIFNQTVGEYSNPIYQIKAPHVLWEWLSLVSLLCLVTGAGFRKPDIGANSVDPEISSWGCRPIIHPVGENLGGTFSWLPHLLGTYYVPDTVIKYLYALYYFIIKTNLWHGYYYFHFTNEEIGTEKRLIT